MMSSNKILTVSYGTFSCTLEGFDDSFDTMKAIAEYFRDLAADDRYFGAEPPQPDAEMLAKIAEREVSRRVEAREHEGRIMLKAHEETADVEPEPVASPAPAPATTAAAAVVAAAAPQVDAYDDVAEDNQAFSAPYTDTPEPPVTEDVVTPQAADVASYEDVMDPLEPAQDSVPAADVADVPTEDDLNDLAVLDGTADAPQDATPSDELASAAAFFAGSVVENAPEPEMEDKISVEAFTNYISAPAAVDVADEGAESDEQSTDAELAETGVAAEPDLILDQNDDPSSIVANNNFAEKLARIRAVVTKQDTTELPQEYDDEDVDAISGFAGNADDAAEHDENGDPDMQQFAQDEQTANDDAQQDIIAQTASDIEEALEVEATAVAEDLNDDLDDLLDEIEAGGDAVGEDDVENDLVLEETDAFETETEAEADAANIFEDESEDMSQAQPEVTGRVMKVAKEAFDEALASGELEEMDAVAENVAAAGEAPEVNSPADAPATARDALPKIDTASSEDVSRLMAEADHQMEEPEGQTRRSAFSHLRAAVAARFADRSMDREAEEAEEQEEAFRSDLAEVVKPRRPEAQESASHMRPDQRPAPLKLVAEQRVDDTEADERIEVAPRRVAAPEVNEMDVPTDTGFAAYAEERGAATLPELLEAAASYLCFVEGRDEFSRPQLMTRVRQADIGEFSREDGLRSFGQLLRNGKIEKIAGGRFAVSDAIGYKPDHRAAG